MENAYAMIASTGVTALWSAVIMVNAWQDFVIVSHVTSVNTAIQSAIIMEAVSVRHAVVMKVGEESIAQLLDVQV